MKHAFMLGASLLTGLLAQAQTTVTVANNATLTMGSTATLVLGSATLVEASGGRAKGGLYQATQTLNAPAAANVGGLGATITSAANLGSVVVTRGATAQTGGSGQSLLRYYDITPATNSGLNATLVFAYADDELNGNTEAGLSLYRSPTGAAPWTQRGGTVNAGANTITLTGIDAFSRWTAATAGTLPVELAAFEAVALDAGRVRLTWTAASEQNNAGFGVQLRTGDAPWQEVAFVAGRGTAAEAATYARDVTGLAPALYRFRLRQVDLDGTSHFSAEVTMQVAMTEAVLFQPEGANPFAERMGVRIAVREAQSVRVEAYDALGRRVATLYDGVLDAGRTVHLLFEAASLPSGLYVLRATGDQFSIARPVVRR